uniref:LP7 n=2 Tax=Leishmania donovani species complex TaxID=38574 RepID=A3EYC3_LEIIN|nr:LP7 [Leishmania infantum]ABN54831.1 LP7 [Leishmania donovani]ABN54824.1 LP7 [Leishmania infantum]ABN54825.1 LP7 [Leishmania infantum]ABN54826.1 LP7 [Leishmania infantum]
MRRIQVLVLFFAFFLVSRIANADVVLRPCTTTQDIINAVTDGNSSHYLFFYDPLDVNSLKVYNTLSALKTKRTFIIDALDAREPQSSWMRSSFEVFYVPMLCYVKWMSNGKRMLDRHLSMEFGSASLAQFLQRH